MKLLLLAVSAYIAGAASVYALQTYTNAAEIACLRSAASPAACSAETKAAELAFASSW